MPSADKEKVVAEVYALLGRPSQAELNYNDVHAARIDAGMQILEAIARNPQNGNYGSLSALVTVAHNAFLPAHSGKPGIPRIVPFAGAQARDGVPADPDQIDSYRLSPEMFSGAVDGDVVAHDEADAEGRMSPVACRYSMVGDVFKFTGLSAQIPMIQITREMANSNVPMDYEPTLVKLIPIKVVKPGSDYFRLANLLNIDGKQDLVEIAGGAKTVRPVRAVADIIAEQQQN